MLNNIGQNKKVKFAYFSALLIALGYLGTAFLPALVGGFSLFVSGILGTAGILSAANVVQKKFTQGSYIEELKIQNSSTEEEK